MRIPDGGKSYTMGMLDGIILGSPLNQNTTVIDRVNQQEIESIEVVRGPNSVLYPSNGIAGTLNVITKEPSKTPIYSLSQEFGSHDFFRTQGSTSGTIKSAINDIGYSVGFNFMENNPWKDRNKSEKGSASGKLVFHPDIDSTLTLRLEHAQTYEEGPGGLTQQQFDSNWQQASPTLKNAYQYCSYLLPA
jgi:outer membrane receptor protein involved in Fe transport